MKILVNHNYEIVQYATVGGFEGDIEINNGILPSNFIESFKPRYFLYKDGEVKVNTNYEEEKTESPQMPQVDFPTSDEALRRMFSSMQVQIVQGNKMVTQLTQQNANLSQQIVQLQQEIENLKGGNSDETTIS
ncbi:DUF2977 domain-containing protein [Staphylococcus arlettae]|uniref:DUF2977 domain-containing protein n=1 Tax=Staphylococcus arlettae TaxID=29378 RepID=UPI003A8F25ED